MTAHDVVSAVRRRLKTRRVGHAGTLDPLAAGVLPVAMGSFTRLLPYLEGGKTYRAEIAFGRSTTTGDAAGQTVDQREVSLDARALSLVLERFRGRIDQRPPAFSAVHVEGRRAYELAREGIAVDVPVRQVEIHRIALVRFWPQAPGRGPRALLEVDCSAGTYVRSLAEDIGAALEAPAHLSFLLRTRAGAFALDDAQLLDAGSWEFADVDQALSHLPKLAVGEAEAADLRMGRAVAAPGLSGTARAVAGSEIVAIGAVLEERFWPKTVLPGRT